MNLDAATQASIAAEHRRLFNIKLDELIAEDKVEVLAKDKYDSIINVLKALSEWSQGRQQQAMVSVTR
jgi:hypothetical protein